MHAYMIRERASKQTLFLHFFLPVCTRAFISSPSSPSFLRRAMHRGYSISSLQSSSSSSSSSIYFCLFIHLRTRKREREKKKRAGENVKQAVGRERARVRIWITTPLNFVLDLHMQKENREEKISKGRKYSNAQKNR